MDDKEVAKAQILTVLLDAQNSVTGLTLAYNLLEQGYQSDQAAIDAGIQSGIAAYKTQTDAQIASLTAQLNAYTNPPQSAATT